MLNKLVEFNNKVFVAYLIYMLLLSSCAQIVSPNGGKPDSVPPKILKTNPNNLSTNFNTNKIEFYYDEFIQLNEPQKQILISPPLKNFPELKVKGKKLIFEIKDTLKPKTTYSINFGNSIRDITEFNAIANNKYVFSTDSYIDSLKLKGTIVNSFTMLPEENMTVAIYQKQFEANDSCAQLRLPDYFAKTNNLGNYEIENIKNGTYSLVAFNDANSNYMYDLEDERFGFDNKSITIDSLTPTKDIFTFKAESNKLFVQKLIEDVNYLQVILNKAPNFNIITYTMPNLDKEWAITETSKQKDTITYWYSKSTKLLDSLALTIEGKSKVIDTIEVNLKKLRSPNSKSRGVKASLKLSVSNLIGGKMILPNTNLQLSASMPLQTYSLSKIKLIHRRDTLKYNFIITDSIRKKITIDCKFVEDSAYRLILLPGAFTALNGLENDTTIIDFTIQNTLSLGTLKMQINAPDSLNNYIFQLFNEQNNLVFEDVVINFKSIFFKQLQPGKYNMKLIADLNKNGKWDTGNYNKNLQPEKIYIHSNNLTIRPNWDLDETWNLSSKIKIEAKPKR